MNIPPRPAGTRQPANAVEHWRLPKKPEATAADKVLVEQALAERRVTVCKPARARR